MLNAEDFTSRTRLGAKMEKKVWKEALHLLCKMNRELNVTLNRAKILHQRLNTPEGEKAYENHLQFQVTAAADQKQTNFDHFIPPR